MNKKNGLWIFGIIAIALILWFTMRDGANTTDKTTPPNNTQHGDMQHPPANTAKDENLSNYISKQDKAMADMMQAMENITYSGNVSRDFLEGMLPHHAAAIAMSQSYLKHTNENETLQQLAQDIITTQKQEMDEMKALMEELKRKESKDIEKEEKYRKEYNDMLSQHHTAHSAPNRIDEAFAEGMIMHHQMAIDMSKSILKYTQEEKVRTLAQNIINAQEKEITTMQNILEKIRKS